MILVLSLIEYQEIMFCILNRVSGKDAHKIEKEYTEAVRSKLIIGVQLLVPIFSVLTDIPSLFGANIVTIQSLTLFS